MAKKVEIDRRALMQDACSGEITCLLSDYKVQQKELSDIALEYEDIASEESLLDNNYYQYKLDELEKMFLEKHSKLRYYQINLILILSNPIYLN